MLVSLTKVTGGRLEGSILYAKLGDGLKWACIMARSMVMKAYGVAITCSRWVITAFSLSSSDVRAIF